MHIGKNHLDNTFGMALKDYDAIVAHPFQQFLRDVYRTYAKYYAFHEGLTLR